MQKVSKVLYWIENIVFYPTIVLAVVVGLLLACGIRPYITMSGSMEPEIMTGSICFVNTKADYKDIQTGDVIAYETPIGGLVTHEVITVTEEGLETKGINNDVSDGVSTTVENFRGKTLFSVPYVGYILKTLQKPAVLLIVLVNVAGIFLFHAIDTHEAKKKMEGFQAEQGRDNMQDD